MAIRKAFGSFLFPRFSIEKLAHISCETSKREMLNAVDENWIGNITNDVLIVIITGIGMLCQLSSRLGLALEKLSEGG